MFLTYFLVNSYNQKNRRNPDPLQASLKDSNGNSNKNPNQIPKSELPFIIGLFLLELICCIISIILAVRCGKNSGQLFLNVFVAIFFPFFYLLYALVSGCYRK